MIALLNYNTHSSAYLQSLQLLLIAFPITAGKSLAVVKLLDSQRIQFTATVVVIVVPFKV
jgi:hypothetical protein